MITFPCAKINLGLNITGLRPDGYHNIETIFLPIAITDALEVKTMAEDFPSDVACDLKVTGNAVDCNEADNLVIKAYNLIAKDYTLPRVHAHLYKHIPSEAGLGGGSSDGAFMLRLLDERFRLNMGIAEMERYAAKLGADCPFFITADPSYAIETGTTLEPIEDISRLRHLKVVVVKPAVSVSTREAYAMTTPRQPELSCREAINEPIDRWKDLLRNDFEGPAFKMHPELKQIKDKLYSLGARYAQMSGSGSAFFGFFNDEPKGIEAEFSDCFVETTTIL